LEYSTNKIKIHPVPNSTAYNDKESVEKLKEVVLAQTPGSSVTPASLPFNKYTYQFAEPSAVIRRVIILNPPPGPSAQESVGK